MQSMAPPARASARCAEQRRPPAPARPVSGTYARAGLKRRVPLRPGAAVKWCRACCCPPLQHRGARVARPCGQRRRWRVDARRRDEPGFWRSAPTPVGGARRGARWAPPARGGRPNGASGTSGAAAAPRRELRRRSVARKIVRGMRRRTAHVTACIRARAWMLEPLPSRARSRTLCRHRNR